LDVVSVDGIEYVSEKRDYFKLLETSRFTLLPCEGTYFQVASYAAISTENDVAFCKGCYYRIWRGSIPISTFMKTEKTTI
jgi:methionine aminotransferase